MKLTGLYQGDQKPLKNKVGVYQRTAPWGGGRSIIFVLEWCLF